MTALKKYARLETTGLWRAGPEDQRREVVVAFGEASLVLSDARSGLAITHWSLAAVQRRNPGQLPALYAPGPEDVAETVEISEPSMIEAIETVRHAVARRPRRGRLRLVVTGAVVAGLGLAALIWLPDALVTHTTRVVPFVQRQQIGTALLKEMTRFTGAPCASRDGLAALDRLTTRLFGSGAVQVVILRDGLPEGGSTNVPGRVLVVDHALVENYDTPEVLAGHLLAERLRTDLSDPLARVLRDAGTAATLTLLATGDLPAGTLKEQAQLRLQAPPAPLQEAELLAEFDKAQVSATAYALSVDATAVTTRGLIEKDPMPPARAKPLLPDADWLALQAVCSR